MSNRIEVTCAVCGHRWIVDVDELQTVKILYRERNGRRTRLEEYSVRCPHDGTFNVLEIERADHGR